MRRRWSAFLCAGFLMAGALAFACGGDGGQGPTVVPPDPAPTPPPPPAGPPPPPRPPPPPPPRVEVPFGSDANFDILDDSFKGPNGKHDAEAHAAVKTGDQITWTQNGGNIHRVEFNRVPEDAKAMDSGDLRPGNIWGFRPSVPGEYVFFCRYHEYMMDARITVEQR